MSLIDSIVNIANDFTSAPRYVHINKEKLEELASKMKEEGKIPLVNNASEEESIHYLDEVKLELLASSINYCYWYGKPSITPGGISSTILYAILVNEYNYNNRKVDAKLIYEVTKKLVEYRFPMLEDRAIHLEEAYFFGEEYAEQMVVMNDDLEGMFTLLLTEVPGFASDLFSKRACSFFGQLNRKFGWFTTNINKLPIPADNQIPKTLRHFDVLSYSEILDAHIDTNYLLPKGSLMECEIRASAIIACRLLSKKLGWVDTEVDTWLFTKRRETTRQPHSTITTDY